MLVVQSAEQGKGKASHAHPEGQLYIAKRGVIVVEAGELRSVLPPGTMGWVPPGIMHGATVQCGSKEAGVVGYTLYLHRDLCAILPASPTLMTATPLFNILIERMSQWVGGSPSTVAEQNIFQVVMDELSQLELQKFQLPVPHHGRLLAMTTAILENPANDINLDGWAQKLGMSRRTITRYFRAETGMSLIEWRQTARLLRSLELLNSGESVTQVSLGLGYQSVSSFIMLFKKMFGTTPAKFTLKV